MNDAIREGVEEARISTLPVATPEDAVDHGDYVRQKTLEKFEEFDSRPAGSF